LCIYHPDLLFMHPSVVFIEIYKGFSAYICEAYARDGDRGINQTNVRQMQGVKKEFLKLIEVSYAYEDLLFSSLLCVTHSILC
jgi:hypothetical protein